MEQYQAKRILGATPTAAQFDNNLKFTIMANYKRLHSLLQQLSKQVESELELDYNRTYGGYMLIVTKPSKQCVENMRRNSYIRTTSMQRMTAKEMELYLIGILAGIRIAKERLL